MGGKALPCTDCDAKYVVVCALSNVRVVFSTRVAEVDVQFADRRLYLNANCGC